MLSMAPFNRYDLLARYQCLHHLSQGEILRTKRSTRRLGELQLTIKVLVQTGYGAEESKMQQDRIKPDRIAPDLVDSIRLDPGTISYIAANSSSVNSILPAYLRKVLVWLILLR